MSFSPSTKSRVAVGLLNASGYTRSYNLGDSVDMIDTTVLTDTAKTSIPGPETATFSIEMLLDNGTAQINQFTAWKAATVAYPLTVAPFGFSVGSFVALVSGWETNLQTSGQVGQAVMASATGQATGAIDYGVVLEDFTAITADTNGTARDNGAATANGGVAHLHVSDFSGLTSDVVTIEHSVNGSTGWATLVTFSTVTGTTSERIEVAAGTTVRQYLRVSDDVTGTGSTTRFVAFARR